MFIFVFGLVPGTTQKLPHTRLVGRYEYARMKEQYIHYVHSRTEEMSPLAPLELVAVAAAGTYGTIDRPAG